MLIKLWFKTEGINTPSVSEHKKPKSPRCGLGFFCAPKATIKYNFLDYWDVPANETAYNPADAKSAPINNPKK